MILNRVGRHVSCGIVLAALLAACGGGGGGGGGTVTPAPTTPVTPAPVTPVSYEVSTFIGIDLPVGSGPACPCQGVDGPATAATIKSPFGLAVDSKSNLIVSDESWAQIRVAAPDGRVSTLAGNGVFKLVDGAGVQASFNSPRGVAVGADGTTYVADHMNHAIRKITAAGVVSTFVGNGESGLVNAKGSAARLNRPHALVIDKAGNLYFTEDSFYIRKVSPDGTVSNFVGDGVAGNADGSGSAARLNSGLPLAIDADDNLYISQMVPRSDGTSHWPIRKITPAGVVSTLTLTGTGVDADGISLAFLGGVTALAVDAQRNIYAIERFSLIRKISADGKITAVAGRTEQGSRDGPAETATFGNPKGLAVNAQGHIYVADWASSHKVRLIKPR